MKIPLLDSNTSNKDSNGGNAANSNNSYDKAQSLKRHDGLVGHSSPIQVWG